MLTKQNNISKSQTVVNFNSGRSALTNNTNVALVLNWYEKQGKNLVGEEPIKNMTADDMLKLFDAPFWNKLYHCWAVENSHISAIQANVDHEMNTEEFSYFVEIYKTTPTNS